VGTTHRATRRYVETAQIIGTPAHHALLYAWTDTLFGEKSQLQGGKNERRVPRVELS
jgi:hypothetical protein